MSAARHAEVGERFIVIGSPIEQINYRTGVVLEVMEPDHPSIHAEFSLTYLYMLVCFGEIYAVRYDDNASVVGPLPRRFAYTLDGDADVLKTDESEKVAA